ncbi:hypothetical protein MST27_16970 [Pseudomonas sp. PS1]|uniref:Uncharacterized protein n=1 Tax=Stutzerimonas marianensis TaxID=2929513 RepID=A0A9X2AW90_9GAMM|nr:hypothetical protein [Pseudomonas marianensis]MCJ0975066.1 hypothetical protein [Pseudomonas marianensis]
MTAVARGLARLGRAPATGTGPRDISPPFLHDIQRPAREDAALSRTMNRNEINASFEHDPELAKELS